MMDVISAVSLPSLIRGIVVIDRYNTRLLVTDSLLQARQGAPVGLEPLVKRNIRIFLRSVE
jgi:hypothetical protein